LRVNGCGPFFSRQAVIDAIFSTRTIQARVWADPHAWESRSLGRFSRRILSSVSEGVAQHGRVLWQTEIMGIGIIRYGASGFKHSAGVLYNSERGKIFSIMIAEFGHISAYRAQAESDRSPAGHLTGLETAPTARVVFAWRHSGGRRRASSETGWDSEQTPSRRPRHGRSTAPFTSLAAMRNATVSAACVGA